MDAAVFWNVIGNYNSQTKAVQVILILFMGAGFVLSYTHKIKWSAKFVLGIANLAIGILFFGIFGTEKIQKFFALPLYICCGCLFLFECVNHKEDTIKRPDKWQCTLLALYVLYPIISYLLGNTFPNMVTYIMPCPIISLSIAVYSCYHKKNRLLLILLTIWGLTGIKSVIFNAYEDIILLICGIYGIYLIFKSYKGSKNKLHMEN